MEYIFLPLQQKNVDTGMGLERVAQVLQRVKSVYDTDKLNNIYGKVIRFAEDEYYVTPKKTVKKSDLVRHARIITDHLRAATFIIADGIKPSNVDQGYVLRKLIRRAVRSGNQLGIRNDFTQRIAITIIDQYKHTYCRLQGQRTEILNTFEIEEAQFGKTLESGLKHFEKAVHKLESNRIDGQTTFHLYDTYGFPFELTKELATERGLTIDEKGFRHAFEEYVTAITR